MHKQIKQNIDEILQRLANEQIAFIVQIQCLQYQYRNNL